MKYITICVKKLLKKGGLKKSRSMYRGQDAEVTGAGVIKELRGAILRF